MQAERIAALLAPFHPDLSDVQKSQLAVYLELLLRWNARINLTAVRDPDSIVTRHIGESLWAASRLLTPSDQATVIDVGSGAGFPGLPMKIFAPYIQLTLIESQNKKATFLKEVIRSLGLNAAEVYSGRAEQYERRAKLVTLRAVEKFDSVLPVAAELMDDGPGSRLALLVGRAQQQRAAELVPALQWHEGGTVPMSRDRILLAGRNEES